MNTTQSGKVKPKPGAPPAAPTKRRKYAAGDGTPRSRKILLGLIVLCGAAAFLMPKTSVFQNNDSPDNRITMAVDERDVVEQSTPPPPPQPSPLQSFVQTLQTETVADEDAPANLKPVSEIVAFPPSTPEEIDKYIQTVSRYFKAPDPEEKKVAYDALVKLGPEMALRLPKLIETSEAPAMVWYSNLARELKPAKCVEALISRINNKEKRPVALKEMFNALVAFNDPVARDFVYVTARLGQEPAKQCAWDVVGPNLLPAQANELLQITSAGADYCYAAARALGRYGSEPEKARDLYPKIQTALSEAKGASRLSLAIALTGMDLSTVSSGVMGLLNDSDVDVRIKAILALSKSSTYSGALLNALRQDESNEVKLACLRAVIELKLEEALPDLIACLSDASLRPLAHEGLVLLSGKDVGFDEEAWQAWLNSPKLTSPQP